MSIAILDRYRLLIAGIPALWVGVFIVFALSLLLVISLCAPEFGISPYKLFFQIKDNKLEISPDFNSYKILFEDPFYLKILVNSFKLSLISTFFTFILGYPIAYVMSQAEPRSRLLLLILIIAPFWTALLIRVYGWMIILKNNGLLNQLLLWSGIIEQPLVILNTQVSVVIGIIYTYLPFMVLPIYSSLLKIKPNVIEAAADLGSKPFSIFWQITFPLSLPGVIIGVFLVLIPALGEFVIPDLLGGAKIITIGKLLWTEFFMNRDWPMAAAITLVMIIIVVIPIKIVTHIMSKNLDIEVK